MMDNGNDAVTVAVLTTELRHLDERSSERHDELVRRFDRHEEDHKEQAGAFDRICDRLTALEHWRTKHRAELGTLARVNAAISASFVALGELARWLLSRGSP